MAFEQVLASLGNVVKAGYKTNAFAPLVWFVAIATPLLIWAIWFTEEYALKILFSVVLCFIIVFTAIMYVVIFLKDPKLLQSERFRIEDKKLDLIAQKGQDITIMPVDITPPPQLEEGGNRGS